MGNLNITYLWRIIAYASACQCMLSISIAFLTYEGLTCNILLTYARRVWSEQEVHLFHVFKYIWSFHTRFIKQAFGESYHPYHLHAHPCLYLNMQSTIINVALVQTLLFSLDMVQKTYCKPNEQLFPIR